MGNHAVDREKTESAVHANIKLSSMVAFEFDEKGNKIEIELKAPEYVDARIKDFQLPSRIKVEPHEVIRGEDGKIQRRKIDRSQDIEIGD